ncbi:MAG: bifunctional sulfate adenylyltransferase/adenylylsulfate kinase [Acidobacteriota bacterium]
MRDLMAAPELAAELRARAVDWPSWTLDQRQACDLELLLNGGFAPLTGFQARADYEAVLETGRLTGGEPWPIPVTLDVDCDFAAGLRTHEPLALRSPDGELLASLHVTDVWEPDLENEAESIFGTTDSSHRGVALLQGTRGVRVGGAVQGVMRPHHDADRDLRLGPTELRTAFARWGWQRVVGFQTRNPMHRAHHEITLAAARSVDANVLLHPVVGLELPGDIDARTRIRSYRALQQHYPPGLAALSLLPLAMRLAGPREAVWHAILRKNHGCTHFIVGRDHAGPGPGADGRLFYRPEEASEVAQARAEEIGIEILPFETLCWVEELARHVPLSEVPERARVSELSGTELRRRLRDGLSIPSWFSFPEVVDELRPRPPRRREGFTILFTGLSGAGKSTTAALLATSLRERRGRDVTMLDGDEVRRVLSSELGFSREHRDVNIRRIGFVAAEVARHGGVAVCAPIAPYDQARAEMRARCEGLGGFVLVHVATSLETCEQRDAKGLYAKARAGEIPCFTGVSDPYEEPTDAEVVVDAGRLTPDEAVAKILRHLEDQGWLD